MKSNTFDFTLDHLKYGLIVLYPWSAKADAWIADTLPGWERWADGFLFTDAQVPVLLEAIQGAGLVINL